jgi:hypothetical protein
MHPSRRILGWGVAVMASVWRLSAATFEPELDAVPHRYFEREATDRFTRRMGDLGSERLPLDRSSELAFVKSLLKALEVPESSQMLVFSNTSLQLSLINPSNPRALYFNDDLYLGWVPGGKIEVATIDAELGAVFYIFDIPQEGGPVRVERAKRCMNCHANEDTFEVPGLVVKSVAPAVGGGSLDAFRKELSGHGVPISERFGGWHVTGDAGVKGHLGNQLGRLYQGEITWTPLEPGKRFGWNRYPVPTSDLVAHLVHEHQVGGVNRMVRAQYRIRALRHVGGGVLGKEASAEVDADVREVVRYLLFADEVPLTAGALSSEGDFARAFVVGRKAVGGRSLKDLELRTRLFRHRCSFLVHTPLFAGLDPELRKRVLDGMGMALAPGEGAVEFRYLGEDEKQTIRGILRETVAGWGGR